MNMKFHSSKKNHRRAGATLLDVALGSMLLSVLLIPALKLMSDSRASSERLHQKQVLVFEAERIIEAAKVTYSEPTAFQSAYSSGTDVSSSVGTPDTPAIATRLQTRPDTTVSPAQLLTINVDAWYDVDRDSVMDASEQSYTLRTQWAAP